MEPTVRKIYRQHEQLSKDITISISHLSLSTENNNNGGVQSSTHVRILRSGCAQCPQNILRILSCSSSISRTPILNGTNGQENMTSKDPVEIQYQLLQMSLTIRSIRFVSEVQIPWQVLRFVNLEAQIARQARRFAGFVAGTALCEPRSADFVAQHFVNLEVQISWQAQHLLDLEAQISWLAQHFVNLEVQGLWQAQHFVNLEVQISRQAQHFVNLADSQPHTHTHSHSLTLSLSLSHSFIHTHTLTHTHSPSPRHLSGPQGV